MLTLTLYIHSFVPMQNSWRDRNPEGRLAVIDHADKTISRAEAFRIAQLFVLFRIIPEMLQLPADGGTSSAPPFITR